MPRSYRPIPDWYVEDWTPAQGRGELPQMTWEDLELSIPRLLVASARREQASALTRELWLQSARLEPMMLLQKLLWMGAQAFTPARTTANLTQIPMTPASGLLPRWSYTDVEVALSYTWNDQALLIANERYRDLLAFRGEGCSGAETARRLFLLVSGLPVTATRQERAKTSALPRFSAAA